MLTSDVYTACVKATMHFEQEHAATVMDFDFTLGNLILIWNTAIKKSLNCKMHTRYLGPLIVIFWNRGGVYIIAELDSSVFDCLVTTFRVIPYFTHCRIDVPPPQ